MPSDDPDFPWVFYRDEIDLLEDVIENLYEQFFVKEKQGGFEYAVLHEHMHTEALSDEYLASQLGMKQLLGNASHLGIHELRPWDTHDHSFRDVEQDLRQHPLYRSAKVWSDMVSPVAKHMHEQGGRKIEHVFRVYFYSLCVPLKVFLALDEEEQEDGAGYEIAEEEYRLAIIYLQRILESLTEIPFHAEEFDWMHQCRSGANELISHLSDAIVSLQERRSRLV